METRKHTRSRRKPKAATKDVVGNAPTQPHINPKWQKYYKRLVELRDHLVHSQGDLARDGREELPMYSTHVADAGTDNYDRDLALGMLSSEQDALYEIEEAITRIHDGTYGICELTGKPIERERLEAIPWTRFSAAAEKQLEREGVVKRARLGPRYSVTRPELPAEPEEE